jgi:hypothetical protein
MKTKLIIIGLAAAIHVQADTNFFEILTCGGDTYTNATITQVTPAYVTLTYDGGVAQLPLRDLPENVQQQYHYNSNAAAQFRLEQKEKSRQLRAAEATRRTAAVRQAADEAAKAAQFARSPAGLDAEAKQMRQAGLMELSAKLVEHFPEKVLPYQKGWMDVTFNDLSQSEVEVPEMEVGLFVTDKNGDSFFRATIFKQLNRPELNTPAVPNPLATTVLNFKHGDKIRLIGHCYPKFSDSIHEVAGTPDRAGFLVEQIEIIETAAEKKAREQAGEKP